MLFPRRNWHFQQLCLNFKYAVYKTGRTWRKCVFGRQRTAKSPISLRIRAVWSGPSLSANRTIECYRMFVSMKSECPDEILRICRKMWIRTFCACSKAPFRLKKPKWYLLATSYTSLQHTTIINVYCYIAASLLWPWRQKAENRLHDTNQPQREKTHRLVYTPNEDSVQPAQYDQGICRQHEKTTCHLWLSGKLRPVKIMTRLRECAGISESSLGAHVWRYVFERCGLNELVVPAVTPNTDFVFVYHGG